MFGKKIKVSDELMARLQDAVTVVGCSSVDEFAERVLTAEIERVLAGASTMTEPTQKDVEAITKKLKGLGYLE